MGRQRVRDGVAERVRSGDRALALWGQRVGTGGQCVLAAEREGVGLRRGWCEREYGEGWLSSCANPCVLFSCSPPAIQPPPACAGCAVGTLVTPRLLRVWYHRVQPSVPRGDGTQHFFQHARSHNHLSVVVAAVLHTGDRPTR